MDRKTYREIFYYKNYYLDFYKKLKPEVKKKFDWTLQLISIIDRVPEKYFKHYQEQLGYTKFELKLEPIFTDCFAFLTEDN